MSEAVETVIKKPRFSQKQFDAAFRDGSRYVSQFDANHGSSPNKIGTVASCCGSVFVNSNDCWGSFPVNHPPEPEFEELLRSMGFLYTDYMYRERAITSLSYDQNTGEFIPREQITEEAITDKVNASKQAKMNQVRFQNKMGIYISVRPLAALKELALPNPEAEVEGYEFEDHDLGVVSFAWMNK
jgi:hypothetical protein